MKRRIFAFLMAMMMLISTVPAEVLATTLEGNAEPELYFIDDTIWVPEGEEPTAAVVETGEWVKTEETVTESQLVCPEAEHTHHYNCPVDEEGNYTCGGGEEHVHVTDGCASDCAIAEHTHGEECYQQTTLVKWTVALKEDSYTTYANGTDLGWEYAIIEAIYRNGRFGGYELTNPTGSNHLGSHLTVTINGTAVSEYNSRTANIVSNALSASTTGKVVISVNPGSPYYISEMILACGDRSSTPNPFGCDTKSTSDAYTFPISGTPTSVTANLSAIYNVANHGSDDDDYFIMIELAHLPAPVYVGYDSGKAGDHVIAARPVSETGNIEYTASGTAYTATPVESYPTWGYPTAASTHSAFGISPEAEAEANTHGYSFAGWHLEYYTEYEDDSNEFSGEMTVGGTNLFKGASVTLTVHAKLTAIWQPMESLSVSKVWDDSDNLDGIRPGSVVIHLLRNGVHNGTPVTLSAENNWSATWNIPSKDENGQPITWSVEEVVPNGYTSSVSGDAESGFVLTNTHAAERTSAHVQKVWHDDGNRDGVRPYGVQVQLYCNGEAVTSYTDASGNTVSGVATLTEAGSWSHEWLGLMMNKAGASGEKNVYTVREIGYVDKDGNDVENPGYTVQEGEDAETGVLLITNTRQSATMDIPVEKVWSDAGNQDNLRPSSVTVTLTANGVETDKTLTLDETNGWKGIFQDVYVNAGGSPIHYSVIENAVTGYTMSLSGNSKDGFVVTNSHTPETTSVPVSKVWNDNGNQDGKRPDEIVITLQKKDGESWTDVDTLELNVANNWISSFTGVPKYVAGAVGQLVEYRVLEKDVPAGYTVSYDGNTITNTHTPETANLNVKKVWSDSNDQDGLRTPAVIVTLYINGEPSQYTATLSEENSWTDVWKDMPRYHEGQRISYSVVETGYIDKDGATQEGVPTGYTVDHSYENAGGQEPTAIVTNIHVPTTTDLNVQKIWDDDDNRAGKRPDKITVTLLHKIDGQWSEVKDADGNPLTKVLNAEKEWDDTFEDLPMYHGGEKIIYNVVEADLDPSLGYEEPTYSVNESLRVLTVTNAREAEKINVTVTKNWSDENNRDNIRPSSVTVTLYANGIDAGVSEELNAGNNWTATFANLYKHYNGKDVAYSVVETPVDGYTANYNTISTEADGSFTIEVENVHVPEVISIPVAKSWDDDGDRDGIRPDSITIQLYADGAKVDGKTLTLDAGNNWSDSFDDLPKYKDGEVGKEIEYTFAEVGHTDLNDQGQPVYTVGVPEGYADGYAGNTITNVHTPETVTVTAKKTWADDENRDGKRPASVTLHLLANGDHTGKSIVLNGTKDNNPERSDAYETEAWVATWSGLYKFEEGKAINYTVYEEVTQQMKDDGYSVSYSQTSDYDYVVTNTRNVNKTTFTVQKIWSDANNQDNVRYPGVAVQLYANGTAYGNPIELTADMHWRYTWTDLNVNAAGNPITYTVKEVYYQDASGNVTELTENYYSEPEDYLGTVDSQTGIATITNVHDVMKTNVTVRKVWDDDDDRDRIRDDSVTVMLYRNGEPTNQIVVLNDANSWTHTFVGLDVHHGIGVDNVYTVVEVVEAGKDADNKPIYKEGTPAGYTVSYETDDEGVLVVKNTHAIETVSIPVIKVWDDNADQDGKRPGTITITLKKKVGEGWINVLDGENKAVVLTLNASQNWQGVFENLPAKEAGVPIVYRAVEAATADYNVDENGVAQDVIAEVVDGKFTITNVHEVEKTTVTAMKFWEDGNNQDNVRPQSISLHLLANGEHMGTDYVIVLDGTDDKSTGDYSEIDAWVAKWNNLPKNKNGKAIKYTVREEITESMTAIGYAVSYPESKAGVEQGVLIVENTRRTDTTTFVAKKAWEDDDNKDGKRPYAVVLELYKDGQSTGIKETVTAADDWAVTWTGLDKNDDGTAIRYTAMEVGYYATEAELDNQQSYTSGLPQGYTVNYPEGNAVTSVYEITNSRETDKISVTVTKNWVDNNNQDGIRPESVTVELYCNGQPTGYTKILSDENGWKATFENQEKNHGIGVPNVYTVVEIGHTEKNDENQTVYTDTVPEHYTDSYETAADGTLIVKNTHTPEVISIPVMKVWNDNNDQDGIRPVSVKVILQKKVGDNWVYVDDLTLDASKYWRDSFVNLDKNSSGNEIKYRVAEEAIAGYNVNKEGVAQPVVIEPDANGDVRITNTHDPETISISATKVWNDNNNQDGKRPAEITLHLLANGVHMNDKDPSDKDYKIVLDGTADSNGEDKAWKALWSNLPKFEEGKEINYTVYEQRVDEKGETLQWVKDGYISSNSRNGNDVTITNTRAAEKTSFTVQKVWSDTNNQDNVRYPKVAVQLYANGTAQGAAVELDANSSWRHTWFGLDKNAAGSLVNYDVKELYYVNDQGKTVYFDEQADGYTDGALVDTYYVEGQSVEDPLTGIATITNTHAVEKTSVTVTKVWDDENNQDGIRPYAVIVALYRNGQPTGQTAVLKADSDADHNWKHTFTDLDVHHGIGVDNVYTVAEIGFYATEGGTRHDTLPLGYTAKVTGTAAAGYTVTNSHTPEVISIPVSKVWDDNGDQDGIRPDEIIVTLQKKDGNNWVDVDTRKLSTSNNWSSSFDNLHKYQDGAVGELVEYRVQELVVADGYTVSYNGNTITNMHTPETAKLTVVKAWEDANNQDGKRPEAVEITLYANGRPLLKDSQGNLFFGALADETGYERFVLTLSEGNNWTGAWENMPRFHNGQRISYSVVETGFTGYNPETDKVEPQEGLPKGYTVTHKYEGQTTTEGKATVTNKYTPELTDLNVQKVWDDDDNRAGKRPESVTVTLWQKVGDDDWAKTNKTATLSSANEWDATFSDLPKFAGGVPIIYNVVEDAVDGYETAYKTLLKENVEYHVNGETKNVDIHRVVSVINTRKAEKINVTVTKDWDDENNQDGIRPDSVVVTLYANGIDAKVSKTLNAGNNWTATFEDLYKHYKGKEVVYTVVETPVDGYTAEYTSSADSKGNVTVAVNNVHEPEMISIPVTKSWDDADNQDGIRPGTVTVQLYADGVKLDGKTLTLKADNNWTDIETFVDLPKFANGKEIIYSVVEKPVTGYTVKAGSNVLNAGEIKLVNVHTPEETVVTATKVWEDENDRDGKRPEELTLHLLKNGEHTGKKIVLDGKTDANGEIAAWKAQWTELPKFESGREIVYTVYEEIKTTATADAGISSHAITDYVPSYTFDPENWNNITVTNSYQPEKTQVNVLKVWNDGGDRDGMRPESIEVKLFADGKDTGKKLVLNAENNWIGEWKDLYKYRDSGVEIAYTVEETTVPLGYKAKTVQDTEFAGNMFIITNTHEPATTGVSVRKLWNDENDNDGKRPDGIIVQLYANGSAVVGGKVLLSMKNNWSHVFHTVGDEPLYVFDKGEEIRYYVDEVGYVIEGKEYENLPEGYEKALVTESYSTTITNTHLTEKTSVSVEKVWADSDDNDGFRPDKVSVTLYNHGQAVQTVELSEENGWKHVWQNLYKYVSGEEAAYTVEEAAVAEYDTTYAVTTAADGGVYWTVTNTHTAKTKEMTVSKVWVDQNNKEKYRPDSVSVQLYKDGKAYGDVIVLSAKNNWKQQVTLPVYDNGDFIVWTIAETKIPKYYSVTYNHATLTVTNTIQSKEIPKTGDDSHLSMWIGTMALSCAGIAVMLLDERKRRSAK